MLCYPPLVLRCYGMLEISTYLLHLMLTVDGTEVVDREFGLAFRANLCHLVARGLLEGLDQRVNNIDEDDLVSRLVQELGDETTADVATAKVDCLLSRHSVVCVSWKWYECVEG